MANGTRLSKQNYCMHCAYRRKDEDGTFCMKDERSMFGIRITDAMNTCTLLLPFDKYKSYKESK